MISQVTHVLQIDNVAFNTSHYPEGNLYNSRRDRDEEVGSFNLQEHVNDENESPRACTAGFALSYFYSINILFQTGVTTMQLPIELNSIDTTFASPWFLVPFQLCSGERVAMKVSFFFFF